jgi:hypothetical protein
MSNSAATVITARSGNGYRQYSLILTRRFLKIPVSRKSPGGYGGDKRMRLHQELLLGIGVSRP